jgi:hypothetical protein
MKLTDLLSLEEVDLELPQPKKVCLSKKTVCKFMHKLQTLCDNLAEALEAQNTVLYNEILNKIREVYHKHGHATNEPSNTYPEVSTKGNLDNREAGANDQEGGANNQEGRAND